MAPSSRRTEFTLSETLSKSAEKFDFFQAVRLLRIIANQHDESRKEFTPTSVGRDGPFSNELVRFRSCPECDFPTSEVKFIREIQNDKGHGATSPNLEMGLSFMGLAGANGTLPQHYTQLILERIHAKDFALRDFCDLFNHRSISLFFRACEKYRILIDWERVRLEQKGDDLFSESLRCLVGFGTKNISKLSKIDPNIPLYYSGIFAQRPRSVFGLQTLISDRFNIAVVIKQFFGRWLDIPKEQQSRLMGDQSGQSQYQQLGRDMVLGERSWDIGSKFRICLQDLSYNQFQRLMPNGELFFGIHHLTRTYVGTEFDFDIQPLLKIDEFPDCVIDNSGKKKPALLGWNTWLGDARLGDDREAAVFAIEGSW